MINSQLPGVKDDYRTITQQQNKKKIIIILIIFPEKKTNKQIKPQKKKKISSWDEVNVLASSDNPITGRKSKWGGGGNNYDLIDSFKKMYKTIKKYEH